MNPKHEIIWTDVAENDLKGIIEYICIDSQDNALAVLKKIKQSASTLYTLPERGRIVPELKEQGILQYREIIVSPWRLIYRIDERKIYILSVIDSRRNVEDILLSRLVYR